MARLKAALMVMCVGATLSAMQARAQDDDPDAHKLTMHQLTAASPLPKAHKNFERFKYRPAGDKIIEQPEANRLMFWTRDGKPDGYAEQHGNAIFYYDAAGHISRVQDLEPGQD